MASTELQGLKEPSAIVIFSDGDFTQALSATDAVNASPSATGGDVAPHNIPVYALGLGSSEGEAIPLPGGDWLRYQGQPVISRLNDDALRLLIARYSHTSAADAALHYSPARDDADDWQRLYDQGIAELGKDQQRVLDPGRHHWHELYPWVLFPALVLLWLALLPWRMKPLRGLAHTLVILGLGLLFLLPPPMAQAAAVETAGGRPSVDIEGAYRQYAAGHFAEAIQRYKQIPGYDGRLGEGASRYKNDDFHGAVGQFSRATLLADSEEKRAAALFNLGNSYFQIGNYPSAIDSFRDALLYNPQSKAAQHNLAFSRALKKAVDKQRQRAERMGAGPQLAPARNDLSVQESGSMAIDETESVREDALPLPELADLSDAALQALIDKGLAQIRLAASAASSKNAAEQQKTKLAMINAHLRMLQLQDQQALLWKRLFEMEEGFPAPLDAPRTVPGVAPW
jgi:tetratricopeptide (TPR) repeat protein